MGHIRLAEGLPQTRKWKEVVALLAEGASLEEVAGSTAEAADKGLALARGDPLLHHVLWVLAHTVLAAREQNFAAHVGQLGVTVPTDPTLYDLVSGFSEAIDAEAIRQRYRSDLGEMAELAAVESLTALCGAGTGDLFATPGEALQQQLASLSTSAGFGRLARTFFGRFIHRFLAYHLSRETSTHVGQNQRFDSPQDHSRFFERLAVHSHEAAGIVELFAGGWYSKNRFENGISKAAARGFADYSLKKLRDELRRRGGRDG